MRDDLLHIFKQTLAATEVVKNFITVQGINKTLDPEFHLPLAKVFEGYECAINNLKYMTNISSIKNTNQQDLINKKINNILNKIIDAKNDLEKLNTELLDLNFNDTKNIVLHLSAAIRLLGKLAGR